MLGIDGESCRLCAVPNKVTISLKGSISYVQTNPYQAHTLARLGSLPLSRNLTLAAVTRVSQTSHTRLLVE